MIQETDISSGVSGQGSGPRLTEKNDEEERFDAMGNKVDVKGKAKKLTSAELRKKKKERMARRKKVSNDLLKPT